jgi:hypothetical protein
MALIIHTIADDHKLAVKLYWDISKMSVLSERVLHIIYDEEISARELARMLRLSAVTRRRGFTRRYYRWIFKINGDVLEDMQYADIVEVGKGLTRMMEEHETCCGQGCHECGWVGEIFRWISGKNFGAQ